MLQQVFLAGRRHVEEMVGRLETKINQNVTQEVRISNQFMVIHPNIIYLIPVFFLFHILQETTLSTRAASAAQIGISCNLQRSYNNIFHNLNGLENCKLISANLLELPYAFLASLVVLENS